MFVLFLAGVFGAVGITVMYCKLSRFPGRLRFPSFSGRIPTLWGLRDRFAKARKGSRDFEDHDFEAVPLLLDDRDL